MNKLIAIASCLLVLALLSTRVRAQDQRITTVPPALVTADQLEAKLTEVEADPGLDGDAKGRLVALYRKALSNLEEVAAKRSRADAFAETTRTAPEQTQRIRERLAAAKADEPPAALDVAADTPLDQIERQFQREQGDGAAVDAQRAELERQLAYQENRPALIRLRLTAAQEEQEIIAAALQAELAGDTGSAPGSAQLQARRWGLETRYIALSTEIQALDQELLSLPMRLDLLAARRDEASANNDRIEQRVEALRALLNDRREAAAQQAKTAAQAMVQATASLDPALARLAKQNADLAQAFASVVEQSDRLDSEQQQVERLAARTTANFERAETAKAVGVPSEGLGQLLLEHGAALPDVEVHARRASALERQIAAVTLSRLRHMEEVERLADPAATATQWAAREPGAGPLPATAAHDLLRDLLEQRRSLLGRQLEAEGRYLEQLRKLQTAEARMLESALTYDAFLKEQLFWVPTGTKTRPPDLAKLPQEVRLLFATARWSELARTLGDQVATAPVFWLTFLLSAVLLWKRRALTAAIQSLCPSIWRTVRCSLASSPMRS